MRLVSKKPAHIGCVVSFRVSINSNHLIREKLSLKAEFSEPRFEVVADLQIEYIGIHMI